MRVCSGGSMKIICPPPSGASPMSSSTVPWLELYVFGSLLAASTSANRLRAQKSNRSFRYTGASSLRRRHTP